jgi:hypothetical protein
MRVKVVDGLFLVAHGAGAPTDAEWAGFLGLVHRSGIERTQMLGFTEGGGPTRAQIDELDAVLLGRVPIAVISPSLRVRMRLAPLSWWDRPRVRAFGPAQLSAALAHLDVPAIRKAFVERELERLRADAGRGR